MNRKLICLLIAIIMVFTCIPAGMFAEGEDTLTKGDIASIIKNVIEETAPTIETVEEPEEEIAEPAAEVDPAPEEEQAPAEEPAAEEPAELEEEEAAAPAAEESLEEEAVAAEDAFVAGLAYLSAGTVFADAQLAEEIGSVVQEAIIFANARVTGEGELADNDVIEIVANIENQLKTLYVKNERLTYLDEAQAADDQAKEHAEAIDYLGTKLDAVAFTSVEEETKTVEEPVTVEEEIPEEIHDDSEVTTLPETNEEKADDAENDQQSLRSAIEKLLIKSKKSEPVSEAEPIEPEEEAPVEAVVDVDEETELVETASEPAEDVMVIEESTETVEIETADTVAEELVEIEESEEAVEVELADAFAEETVEVERSDC